MNIQTYNKAIVAVLIPVILAGANLIGITPEMPFAEAVAVAITAFFVWLVPNKK